MKKKLALAAAMAISVAPAMVPTAAVAQGYDRHYRHDYHGRDRGYRHRCGGGNGAVGTIVGGAGGALLGNALGGGTLGTVGGGVGGALIGRHFDKQHTRHRRGC